MSNTGPNPFNPNAPPPRRRGMFTGDARRQCWAEERALSDRGWGIVSGVHFDFRHPALEPGKWTIPAVISSKVPLHPGFHISRPDGEESLGLANIFAVVPKTFREIATEAGRIFLSEGDRVSIGSAEVHPFEDADPFAHEADRQVAFVSLKVTRQDGSEADAGEMALLRVGCMSFGFTETEMRPLLRKRLAAIEQDPRAIADPSLSDARTEVQQLALQLDQRAADFQESLWEQQDKMEDEGLLKGLMALGGPVYELDALIGLAVSYGYRHGLLEASVEMKQPALAKLKHVEAAREAGRLRGIKTRPEFAREYWAKHPEASVYAVHQQYVATHKEDDCTLSNFTRSVKTLRPAAAGGTGK